MKAGRRDTDDGEGLFVELDDAADDAGVVVETHMPVCVCEHDVRRAVGAAFVGLVEEAAEEGLEAEDTEVVAGDGVAVGALRIAAGIHAGEDHLERGEVFEGVVAGAEVEVVGVRLQTGIDAVLGTVEVFGVGDVERAQDEAVHEAEDNGVGADGERERGDGGEGKAGRFAEHAQGEAEVGEECLEELGADGFVGFHAEFLIAAEFDTGAALGFGAGEAGALEVVGAALNVSE